MKKTDIAMIILIAAVSVMVAFFVTQAIVGTPSSEEQTVKTIERIDETVEEPDAAIFNQDAINPAVEVQITTGNTE
jgi:hypothetical protein